MNRRGFLGAMLGAMAAPAIVRAESLMKIAVPKKEIILPSLAADFDGDTAGWVYEPGSWSGHDMYCGPGGARFDRNIFAGAAFLGLMVQDENTGLIIPKTPEITPAVIAEPKKPSRFGFLRR